MRTANQTCLGVGVALAVACAGACNFSPAKTCSQDSDCPSGSCDTSLGVCVFYPPDAGDAGLCSPGCPDWQQCIEGACFDRYTGLRITTPDAGAVVGATVQVTATLTLTSGLLRNDPPALAFAGACPGGTDAPPLALVSAGLYAGTWKPSHEGSCRLTVSWPDAGSDAGLSGPVSPPVAVTVDKTPPTFVASVLASPYTGSQADPQAPGAWRRDDVVVISISSTDLYVNPSSVRAQLLGTDGDAGPSVPVDAGASCGSAYCGTALLDLAAPTMNAFRTSLPIVVTGADQAGNAGATTQSGDSGVSVTRWRWEFDTGTGLPATSPAIGAAGTVYFGTSPGTSSLFYAANPNGGIKWMFDGGAVVGSPSIGVWDGGNEAVYVATNASSSATVWALSGTDGAATASCAVTGGTVEGSLSVGTTDSLETAFAVFNGAGVLVGFRPDAGASFCVQRFSMGDLLFPGAVATTGSSIYYGDSSGALQGLMLQSGNWAVLGGSWPVSGRPVHALAMNLNGTNIIGGNALTPGPGGLFGFLSTNGTQTWTYQPDGGSAPAWNPSIASNQDVLFGADDKSLTRIPFLGSVPTAQHLSQSPVIGAPVLGQDGFVYSADKSSLLTAFDSSLSPLWSLGIPGTQSSLTLDCARDTSGAKRSNRPGTLYMTTSDGKLDAFIVDSRSIDATAPWPKYQHDPRNTGNSSTSLTEFVCP
jgi:hypothetical protein